ncbi:hypothetical protein SBD_8144 [Streptomyces bottropensis ATCC 25435]|uniref:Uncharacterized protein n=1 Tax=Streptomyces bottropensis ATCC 25435 TaxID=1054862 RepID=M3E4L1_9ACTN|nr:hypothetical protein SBD_8144 [Streptomyces bottropensis ATCC 25435]
MRSSPASVRAEEDGPVWRSPRAVYACSQVTPFDRSFERKNRS